MRRGNGHAIQVKAALSATAVAGVMVLGPWTAIPAFADSSNQPGPQAGNTLMTQRGGQTNGVGQTIQADFGFGKKITVEPEAGTFPAESPPDLNGRVLQVTDSSVGITVPCTLTASAPGPATCSGPAFAGDKISVELPADQVSDGFLTPPPLTFTIPDCPSNQTTECVADETIELPGTWRPVGLEVTYAVTGKPVVGAGYVLCAPATTSTDDCPAGTAGVGSGADGTLQFPGVYQGSSDYQVLATSVPAPYFSPSPQPLNVPPSRRSRTPARRSPGRRR